MGVALYNLMEGEKVFCKIFCGGVWQRASGDNKGCFWNRIKPCRQV